MKIAPSISVALFSIRFEKNWESKSAMRHEFGSADKGTYFQIVGKDLAPNQHILLTVSSNKGEASYLLTNELAYQTKARDFVQAPRERVEVKRNPKLNSLFKYAQFVGYGMLAILVLFTALSFAGTFKSRVVLTGSMAPNINPGDIVITVPVKDRLLQKGDVVTYRAKRFNGEGVGIFTHRIIGGDANTGFLVKGDHNPSPDIQRPKIADILGLVVFRIPFLGHLITPRALAILIPTIIGLWLVIDSMLSNK